MTFFSWSSSSSRVISRKGEKSPSTNEAGDLSAQSIIEVVSIYPHTGTFLRSR